jgi:Protein of unknown function (DUF3574)
MRYGWSREIQSTELKHAVLTSLIVILTVFPMYGLTNVGTYAYFYVESGTEKFIRTELYFGRSIPTGGTVSELDWQKFVDEVVTPRFPDGLTVLDADGQWRGKDGLIAREESKVIVLLYPRKRRKAMNTKIEEIRTEYKKRFAQEAVMRIDVTKSVEVTF